MDCFFRRGSVVCLRNVHNKYLAAGEDEDTVWQHPDGSSAHTRWNFLFRRDQDRQPWIKFTSYNGRYLTANQHSSVFCPVGRKVRQTVPLTARIPTIFWRPIQVDSEFVYGSGSSPQTTSRFKLESRAGGYLWANGGWGTRFPCGSAVTSNRNPAMLAFCPDWVIWDVEVLQCDEGGIGSFSETDALLSDDSFSFRQVGQPQATSSAIGRTIFYTVAGDDGEIDESSEWSFFTFHGMNFLELTSRLKQETKLDDVTLLVRSPIDQLLCPLFMPLLPSVDWPMRIVVVDNKSNALNSLLKKQSALASTSHASTGGHKFSYTVTDDLSKIGENSEWFSSVHSESLTELPARLKEETQLNDILLYMWNPGRQLFVPFDPSVPSEDNLLKIAVVNTKSNAASHSKNAMDSLLDESFVSEKSSVSLVSSSDTVVEGGQNNNSTGYVEDERAEDDGDSSDEVPLMHLTSRL